MFESRELPGVWLVVCGLLLFAAPSATADNLDLLDAANVGLTGPPQGMRPEFPFPGPGT